CITCIYCRHRGLSDISAYLARPGPTCQCFQPWLAGTEPAFPFAAAKSFTNPQQNCYFGRVALGSPLGSKNTSIPPFSLLVNAAACSPSLLRTAITPRFSSHPIYAISYPVFPF